MLKFLHSFSIPRTAECRDYKFGEQQVGLLSGRDVSLPVPVWTYKHLAKLCTLKKACTCSAAETYTQIPQSCIRLLSSLISTSQEFLRRASKHTAVVAGKADQELSPLPKLRTRYCLSSAPKFLLFVPRHESKSQIQTMRAEGQLGRSAKYSGRRG